MGRDITNLAASVRQRLLNVARASNRPFNEVLQHFAMERFLYRLAASPYTDRFVLKGALMMMVWEVPVSRPIMDIDLPAPRVRGHTRESLVAEKFHATVKRGLPNSRMRDDFDRWSLPASE